MQKCLIPTQRTCCNLINIVTPATSHVRTHYLSHLLPHILIVDDDERLRQLIGRFLREEGFRVTMAANADEARKPCRRAV